MGKKLVRGIVIILILTFFIFIKIYYGSITLLNIMNHYVVVFNILLNSSSECLKKVISYMLEPAPLQTLIICGAIIYIFKNTQILDIFSKINRLEVGGIKILQDGLEKKKDELESEKDKLINEKDKEDLDSKINIIQTLIDNRKIVELLDLYISKNKRNIRIPLSMIPNQITAENLGKIFEIKFEKNSLKIIGLKQDNIIDIYNELLSKGIIYPEIYV